MTMKMNEMFPGKWLKKEDVPTPTVGTITRVSKEEVNADNGGKEMKVVMAFAEPNLKPMILNIGNATAVCELFGDDSTAWIGKRVEIFTDPNVMFGGKRIGGLRLRAPSAAAPAPVPSANGQAGQLWDYSDGAAAKGRQTTAQVLAFLEEVRDTGGDIALIRIRPAGSKDAPVVGSAWLAKHGPSPEPEPFDDSAIPF